MGSPRPVGYSRSPWRGEYVTITPAEHLSDRFWKKKSWKSVGATPDRCAHEPPLPCRPPAKGGYFPLIPPQSITPLSAKLIGGTNAGYRVSPFRFPNRFEPQEGTQSPLAAWHRGGKALGFGPRPRDLPASLLFLLLGSTQAPQEQSGRRFRSPAARHAHLRRPYPRHRRSRRCP